MRERQKHVLYSILFFALLIRIVFLFAIAPRMGLIYPDQKPIPMLGDGHDIFAKQMLTGAFKQKTFFPKSLAYSAFIAGIFKISGNSYLMLRLVQIIVSLFLVYFIFLLTKEIFNEGAALIAAVIAAIYPNYIFFSVRIMSEVLYLPLLTLLIYLLIKYRSEFSVWKYVIIGIVNGVLLATRPNIVFMYPFIIFIMLYYAYNSRFSRPLWCVIKCSAPLFIIPLIIISPWIYRNYVNWHKIILFRPYGGAVLYMGNNPRNKTGGGILNEEWKPLPAAEKLNILEKDKYYRDKAISYIKDNPAHFVKMSLMKFVRLWQVIPHSKMYKNWKFKAINIGTYGVILFLFLIGIYITRRELGKLLYPYALILSNTFFIMIFASSLRYRLPHTPFMIAIAASVVTRLLEIINNTNLIKKST